MPSQDRPLVHPPVDHRVVNTPTTAMPTPGQPGRPERPHVDDSRAPTAPVSAARHVAASQIPERRLPTAPAPDQTTQFNRPAASARPGTYSPPAAYSATPYPAGANPTPVRPAPARPAAAHPVRPYPAGQQNPQPAYRPADVERNAAVRVTTTTQRPHRRVDTSVLCAAAALVLLALAVLVGLML